jgi:hypothetical protein
VLIRECVLCLGRTAKSSPVPPFLLSCITCVCYSIVVGKVFIFKAFSNLY